MKNIIIVSWNGKNDVGGVERVTHYLLESWKDKYKTWLIDFATMKKKKRYKYLLGKHYLLDAFLVSVYTNRVVRLLGKECGRNNVIVVTQGFNAPFVRADIAFAHGTMRGYKKAVCQDSRWHLNQVFEKYSWKYAKKVIAVSNTVKQEAINLYCIDTDKIEVLENCVDTDIFCPVEYSKSDTKTTIIFCGRLELGKGLDKLYEMACIIEKKDNFKLLIATPDENNIEVFANMKNTEVKVGMKRDEMNNFYNFGDVMFFPSVYEGFGLVPIECMACGVPVLGYEVGVIADFCHESMKGVALIEGDIETTLCIAKNLADLFESITMRMELHQNMVKKYSYNVYKEKLERLVENVT